MRRLLLVSPHPGALPTEYDIGSQIGVLVAFFVCALVLPTVLAVCTWWACLRPEPEERPKPQQPPDSVPSSNGHPSSTRAPAAPGSQGSGGRQGAGDTGQYSTMTTDDPAPSARPGQPANPISLSTQHVGKPGRQPGTPKVGNPGPSYESDDEGDGRATAQERLNDIARSVKGHANAGGAGALDEAARRQAEEAVKRLTPPHDDGAKPAVAATAEPGVSIPSAADVLGTDKGAAANGGTAAAAAAATAADAAAADEAAAREAPAAAAGAAPAPTAAEAAVEAEAKGQSTAQPEFEIDLDIDLTKGDLKVDYSTRGLLGQGGFAAVYKGRYKGQRVAVKMIKKTAGSSLVDLQEDMNALMHELHILRQVNHPNIVTLFGGCLKPPHIFLVEERMEGTLDFYVHQVRKHDALSVREVVYFALDIACGLSYLHPRIVHRDLKPANVLLSREGRCKISDFGLARTKIKEYLSTKNLDAGTTAYIAPECFMSMDNPDMHDLRRSVTDRTDIYALGIIMWEMLSGKRPWQGLKPLLVAYQVAYRSLRPPLFELGPRCSARLRQLIEECWCQEPKQRPSSQQVVDRLLEILNELPPDQDFPPYAEEPAPLPPPPAQAQPQPPAPPAQQQPHQPQVVSLHDVVLQQ